MYMHECKHAYYFSLFLLPTRSIMTDLAGIYLYINAHYSAQVTLTFPCKLGEEGSCFYSIQGKIE